MVFGIKEAIWRYKYDAYSNGDWVQTQGEIFNEFKKYLDWCYENNHIAQEDPRYLDSYYGYMIVGSTKEESLYSKCLAYQIEKQNERKQRDLHNLFTTGTLVDIMDKLNDQKLSRTVLFPNNKEVIAHFLDLIIYANNREIGELYSSLSERYMAQISNWEEHLGTLQAEYEAWGALNDGIKGKIKELIDSKKGGYAKIMALKSLENLIHSTIVKRLASFIECKR